MGTARPNSKLRLRELSTILVPRVIEKKVPLFALEEFTDIQIKTEDGLEVTRKIVQQYLEIPVIALNPTITCHSQLCSQRLSQIDFITFPSIYSFSSDG